MAGGAAGWTDEKPLAAWRRLPLLRNTELLQRCAWTVALASLVRVGFFIPLPDIARSAASVPAGWAEHLLRGATELPASLFEVGFGPYFVVSIFLTIIAANAKGLGIQVFANWQERGAEGRAKLDRLSRFLTAVVGFLMGLRAAQLYLPLATVAAAAQRIFVLHTATYLTAGTAVLIWLCDAVKEKGISDGYSLLFGLNIVAGFMAHLARALPLATARAVPPRFFAQCASAYIALTLAAVVLTRTELRLPLVHYRALRTQAPPKAGGAPAAASAAAAPSTDGGAVSEGVSLVGLGYADTLPLRMCPGGMMSLIYASIILGVFGGRVFDIGAMVSWSAAKHAAYSVALFATVTAMELSGRFMGDTPKNLAKCLVQLDAGVRGKAPGAETAAYIGALDSQLRLIGGCAMGGLAVAAHLFDAWCLWAAGTTAATSSMLLIASLASGAITQVRTLLQKPALQDLMRRESEALQSLR